MTLFLVKVKAKTLMVASERSATVLEVFPNASLVQYICPAKDVMHMADGTLRPA